MNSWACHIFAFPFGAALLALLAWPLLRNRMNHLPWLGRHLRILWLDRHAKHLLGRCAKPVFLRKMGPNGIERLLKREPGAADIDELQRLRLATWPIQAQLICDGSFEDLDARQAEWLADDRYSPQEEGDIGDEGIVRSFPNRFDIIWLTLVASLLTASILSYVISRHFGCPVTNIRTVYVNVIGPKQPVYINKNGPWSLDLLSDQVFDYNKSDLSPVQKKQTLKTLDRFFSKFQNVKITRIEGFTDPIGTLCSNADLAQGRANSIKTLIDDYIANHPGRLTLAAELATVGAGPSPDADDVTMWRECKAATPGLSQSFGRETPFKPSSRVCAAPNAALIRAYPDALTPTDLMRLRKVPDAAKMSQIQNQLTACVSPMRRVTLSFSGTIAGTTETATGTNDEGMNDASAE